jgi:hypothetical protein
MFKRILLIFLNLIFIISILNCVPNEQVIEPSWKKSTSITKKKAAEQNFSKIEKKIEVKEGSFLFQDVYLKSYYLGYNMFGNIKNNTNKNWNSVTFELDFYDQAGNKIKNNQKITIHGIKIGETQELGYGSSGYSLFSKTLRDQKISNFDIRFKKGEYPATYVFKMIKPTVSDQLTFQDKFIKVQFIISKKQIAFEIKNKTGNPIKIDWNQVSYVDVLQKGHKVMHAGVKYTDRDKVQSPTIIPPMAIIEDIVFPTDYIYYVSGKYGGWRETSLFPEAPGASLYKGQNFSIFMPLEINQTFKNYYFVFNIEDVVA